MYTHVHVCKFSTQSTAGTQRSDDYLDDAAQSDCLDAAAAVRSQQQRSQQ